MLFEVKARDYKDRFLREKESKTRERFQMMTSPLAAHVHN